MTYVSEQQSSYGTARNLSDLKTYSHLLCGIAFKRETNKKSIMTATRSTFPDWGSDWSRMYVYISRSTLVYRLSFFAPDCHHLWHTFSTFKDVSYMAANDTFYTFGSGKRFLMSESFPDDP